MFAVLPLLSCETDGMLSVVWDSQGLILEHYRGKGSIVNSDRWWGGSQFGFTEVTIGEICQIVDELFRSKKEIVTDNIEQAKIAFRAHLTAVIAIVIYLI